MHDVIKTEKYFIADEVELLEVTDDFKWLPVLLFGNWFHEQTCVS